ncbi:Hypp2545 [Branchiostoma lanceolatum]|uniref:Hypp2545 protein n=1 Tax=Branchiostoma lanceolatum TaxID=7740 RepID=A0A8J9ZRQ5_BRALA|nr:Hypp2545 [Branchiostoma lanceolatum]
MKSLLVYGFLVFCRALTMAMPPPIFDPNPPPSPFDPFEDETDETFLASPIEPGTLQADILTQQEIFRVSQSSVSDDVTVLMDAKRGITVYKDDTQQVCLLSNLYENLMPTDSADVRDWKIKLLMDGEEEADFLDSLDESERQRYVVMNVLGNVSEETAEALGDEIGELCGDYPGLEIAPVYGNTQGRERRSLPKEEDDDSFTVPIVVGIVVG